jgi:hypothetical protein
MIYSLGRNTTILHTSTLHKYRCKDVIECGNRLQTKKYNVLTLLPTDSGVSRLKCVGSTFNACVLHRCWVSTAAFLGCQGKQGLAWVAAPQTFTRLVLCIPGSKQSPDILSGIMIIPLVLSYYSSYIQR